MDQRNFRDRKFYERKFSYGFGAIKKYIYINYSILYYWFVINHDHEQIEYSLYKQENF